MRLRLFVLFGAVLASGAAAARADVFQTYGLTATDFTGAPGLSLSGTYVLDESSETITGINLTASTGETFAGTGASPMGIDFGPTPPELGSPYLYSGVFTGSVNSSLLLSISSACAEAVDPCLDITLNGDVAQNVSSVPAVSATPEPGSFALLGSGLIGLAGIMRRRCC